MNIGEPKRKFTLEPDDAPVTVPEPMPVREPIGPVVTPEPALVPAGAPA